MTEQELLEALASADPEQRRQAAARLKSLSPTQMAEPLVTALGDDDWRVRKEATAVAIAVAPAPEVLAALIEALQPGDNVGLRNAAVEALGQYGAAAIEALGKVVADLDADGRKLAAEALAMSGEAAALSVLEPLLEDEDANVRAIAVEALSAVGASCVEQVIPLLERCLQGDDRFQRLAALDGLNRLGIILPWDKIEPLLEDSILQRPALVAAGRSRDPRAAVRLVESLNDRRGSTWGAALAALAELARSGEAALGATRRAAEGLNARARSKLVRLVTTTEEDTERRRTALVVCGVLGGREAADAAIGVLAEDAVGAEAEEALGLMGAAAVPALVEHATDGPPGEQAASLELLGRLAEGVGRESAVSALLQALESQRPDSAVAALRAMTRIGDASCLGPAAAWMRQDVDPQLRQAAVAAVSAMATRHPVEAAKMARGVAAEGPEAYAAVVIVGALGGGVHPQLSEDVEFLSRATNHEATQVRKAAIEALARLPSDNGAEAVAFALTDEEREVQLSAVRALGRMRRVDGAFAGVDHLLDLVESSHDETLVAAAIRALGDVEDPRIFAVLKPLARGGSPMSAVSAVEALSRLSDVHRVDALIEATSHRDGEVVKAALRALAEARDPRAITHVGACLDHDAWDVRRLAADLLGRLGGEGTLGLLRARYGHEPESLVKEAIVRALSLIEGKASRRSTPPPRLRSSGR